MKQIILVALGGGLGAAMRHLFSLAALRLFGPSFPWGTMGVNLFGSFFMGLFIALLTRKLGGSPDLRLFVATGILGGFTTFSAFSLDTITLYERGELGLTFFYVCGTVIVAIGALFIGLWLGRNWGI